MRSPEARPVRHRPGRHRLVREHHSRGRGFSVAAIIAGVATAVAGAVTGGSSPVGAVTYTATANVADSFSRVVSGGWGRADVGGSYSVHPAAQFAVSGRGGQIGPVAAGRSVNAALPGIAEIDQRLQATFSVPALPTTGGGFYYALELRRQANGDEYRARARVWPDGTLTLNFTRARGGSETTLAGSATAPFKVAPGKQVVLNAQVVGTSPVIIQEKTWFAGSTEPSWQASASDGSASRLTEPGSVGNWLYASRGTPNIRIDVVELRGWKLTPAGPTSSSPSASTAPTPSTAPSSTTPSSTPRTTTSAPATTRAPSTTTAAPSSTSTTTSAPPPPPPDDSAPGSAVPGKTSYPVPANATFVSPTGSDSGDGSIGRPYATVAKAVASADSGATIVLRGGTYHQKASIPADKSLTIQAYPGEEVWFDGSTVVSSWKKSDSAWVHTGWTAQFDSTAGYNSAIASNTSKGWTWLDPDHPMAAHPDQAWIDGLPLEQVGSISAVKSGTFYVDYANDALYVGSDPTGHSVRASDIDQALLVNSPRTLLRGFGVRRYATPIPELGTVRLVGNGDSMANVVVSDNASQGISVRATGTRLDHVTAENNGLLGIHANYADGIVITNSISRHNNVEHFNDSPVSGGIKITRTRGIAVSGTVVSDNQGNGLWLDESCFHFDIASDTFANNTHYGFVAELSSTGIVTDSMVTGNGYDGVRITDTSGVKIWNNTFGDNYRAVELAQDSRTYSAGAAGVDPRQTYPDPTMTWVTSYVQLENNWFVDLRQFHVYVYDSTHEGSADTMHLTVDGNVLTLPDAGQSQIGWDSGGGRVVSYKSTPAFTSGTGQGVHDVDQPSNTTTSASAKPVGDPLPLPADVAAVAHQPAGTRHVGTF